MFRIARDPSSGSFIQCLAKITVMVLSCPLTWRTWRRLYPMCASQVRQLRKTVVGLFLHTAVSWRYQFTKFSPAWPFHLRQCFSTAGPQPGTGPREVLLELIT